LYGAPVLRQCPHLTTDSEQAGQVKPVPSLSLVISDLHEVHFLPISRAEKMDL